MTTEAPPPPIAAHAMQLYGPYFTDLRTEAKVTSGIEALGNAHPAEREFTGLHLQYLTLMQLGRNERIHTAALTELQRVRALLERQTPLTDDVHAAVVDLATAMLAAPPATGTPPPESLDPDGVRQVVPPETLGPDGAPLDLPEGVEVWTGHPTDDGSDDPNTIARARPMVDEPPLPSEP